MPTYFITALIIFYLVAGVILLFFALSPARRLPISYDLIYATMDEAVVVIDAHGLVLSLNPSAEQLLEKTSTALQQSPIAQLLPHADRLPLDNERPRNFDCVLENGTMCRGQSIPMIRGGVIVGRLLVLRDVTAQKRAETALRTSEQHAKSILDSVSDMMFRFHQDGTLLGYKAESHQLYGLNVRINEPPQNTFTPEFIDLMLDAIQDALTTGEVDTWVYTYEMPLGGLRHYEARIASCGIDEVIILVRDVTESEHEPPDLAESHIPSKHSEALTRFMRRTAHDIRTPITVIKTTAYLLSRNQDAEKRARNINQLKEQVERLTMLVNQHDTSPLDGGFPL